MIMRAARILVVDDDPDILRILGDNLELDGYEVCTAATAKQALALFRDEEPSLVLLDLSLPDMDGIRVCHLIRAKSGVPIIVLTARDRIPDKVLGLESGADDYLVKPFDYMELAARIRACLRRTSRTSLLPPLLELGDLRIDTAGKVVWKKEEKIGFTQREFNLLLLLARNSGRVMSRADIRRILWPERELYRESRTIDVHIQHLRLKIEDNPAEPKLIRTVQGVGYMLSLPE
jgi:DNA-binding response OmpR family regulator